MIRAGAARVHGVLHVAGVPATARAAPRNGAPRAPAVARGGPPGVLARPTPRCALGAMPPLPAAADPHLATAPHSLGRGYQLPISGHARPFWHGKGPGADAPGPAAAGAPAGCACEIRRAPC